MPNDPYLDASVVWRIRTGNVRFNEADHHQAVEDILSSGLATEVIGLISTGKEANVYLGAYNGAPIAVKMYRLYRTSHRGGRPIKLNSAGWLAVHEYDMLRQAWRGGARVPAPARRVENLLSMRYLGGKEGSAPRLNDVVLDEPEEFMGLVVDGIVALARAGVVHSDLSAYNILVHEGLPWFIDLSEAIRIDRTGYSAWQRKSLAVSMLEQGISSLQQYFKRYDLTIDPGEVIEPLLRLMDSWEVSP